MKILEFYSLFFQEFNRLLFKVVIGGRFYSDILKLDGNQEKDLLKYLQLVNLDGIMMKENVLVSVIFQAIEKY